MLKKTSSAILLFLVLSLGALTVSADVLSDGKKRAREEDKAMVVYFFSRTCSYCEAMERDVLSDKDISATLSKDLVYLRINVDKDTEITRQNRVRGYPTTLLIESTGKSIAKIPGYIPKKDFKTVLAYVKGKHYRMMGFEEFVKASRTQ